MYPPKKHPMASILSTTQREAALAFLFGRINYEQAAQVPYDERSLKLDRMRDLLARLGNPHLRMPIVHLAGTKGKGSTAAMMSAVLSAAGYRVGLFSSPHLFRVEERLAIDGRPASADEFVDLVSLVRPVVGEMDAQDGPSGGPTYFEITTALALLHFRRRNVDLALLEVGMGGRLDSTNVCEPITSVITSISFDHTRQLGHTLSAIASEKAGIIKPAVPVVSGATAEEPAGVIAAVCRRQNSPLVQLGRDFDFQYEPPKDVQSACRPGRLSFQSSAAKGDAAFQNLVLKPLGRHQAANAAVALAVLLQLRAARWRIPDEAIRQGLAEASCPARVEVVSRNPTLIIDAAHNVASVAALVDTLANSFRAARRILVFATTLDKDARGMCELLVPCFDHVVFTRYSSNPRGVEPASLAEIAKPFLSGSYCVCRDAVAAWEEVCRCTSTGDLVCVTGSFYIAAEMREQFDRHPLVLSPQRTRESA